MTHRDGLPRFSARSMRCGDAGHRKSKSFDDPSSAAAALPLRRVDAPHRLHHSSYPTSRLRDLYEP